MKIHDFQFTIDNQQITFYHNTKTHRWDIYGDSFEMTDVTTARALAIADFCKALTKTTGEPD